MDAHKRRWEDVAGRVLDQRWLFDLAEQGPELLISISEEEFRLALADAGLDVNELSQQFGFVLAHCSNGLEAMTDSDQGLQRVQIAGCCGIVEWQLCCMNSSETVRLRPAFLGFADLKVSLAASVVGLIWRHATPFEFKYSLTGNAMAPTPLRTDQVSTCQSTRARRRCRAIYRLVLQKNRHNLSQAVSNSASSAAQGALLAFAYRGALHSLSWFHL